MAGEEDHGKAGGTLPFIIVLMIVLCVGLLVAIMKGAKHQELRERSKATIGMPKTGGLQSAIETSSAAPVITTSPAPWLGSSELSTSSLTALHYDVTLRPDLVSGKFSGWVDVSVRIRRAGLRYIVLHASQLNVTQTRLTRDDGSDVALLETFAYAPHEFWIVRTRRPLAPRAKYNLHLRFEGELGTSAGLYRTSYVNSLTGERRTLVASRFQPNFARRAFPCFDEPGLKSTYSLSVIHQSDNIAVSNMPLEDRIPVMGEETLSISRFAKSVPLAPHQIGLVICDFNHTRLRTSTDIELRIHAPPDQIHKTRYALEIGGRLLELYQKYLNVSLTLSELDLVSLPDGPPTHQWGLATSPDTELLLDTREAGAEDRVRVAGRVARQLARMWFGHLVSTPHWKDVWLSEGMATVLEYKALGILEPDWDMDHQFVTQVLQPALEQDSMAGVLALNSPEHSLEELSGEVTCGKGASILRMLETTVGPDIFQAGLSNFLKRYSFKTARGEELWPEFSKRWGHDVTTLMRPWTSREGFPSITVRVDSFNDSRVFLRQERFVKNYFPPPISNREDITIQFIWQVPVHFSTSGGITGSIWLRDSREVATEVPLHPGEWTHFNSNHTGFFVVHYDLESWDRITQLLMDKHQSVPPADRAGILHDVFALAAAGRVPYDTALTLSLYLRQERDLAPWQAAQMVLEKLSRLLEFSDLNPQFRSYMRKLTEPVYKQLGWDPGDNHQDEMLRAVIINLACSSGNPDCLKEASVRLHTWIQGGEVPVGGMRSLVYRYGMSDTGREEHWAFLWHRYRQAGSALERRSLLDGLAHVREPWIIHRYLKYSMDVTKVNNADFFAALRYIAENPVGRSLVWKFLRDEWPTLMRRFSSDSVHLGTLVFAICQHFTSQFELQEMLDFFQRHPGSWVRRAVETVRSNILWVRRFETAVGEWLRTEGRRAWWEPQLSNAIEPTAYDVLLQPNATLGEFHGRVAISLKVREPSPVVLLHASRLAVGRVRLTRAGHPVPLRRHFLYRPRQYLVVEPNVTLSPADDYRLEVEFRGTLRAPFSALFLHEYRDGSLTERKTLVLSRFYPSGARTAFPCFDEPRFMSIFDMAVSHDSALRALSNMPEREEDVRNDGITTTRFQASVPMSTSRLGIAVGKLPHRETYSTGGTKLRIFASEDKLNLTTFAMDTSLGLLDFFEKYYDIRYPLPKQDMLAVPDLGEPVADDNWGLLVFQEERVIIEDGSLDEERRVALLLANKVSQMWVGHLVSPASRGDTWLPSSFATFIQYKALATIHSGWDENDQFLMDVLGPSMDTDASHFARPLSRSSSDSSLKGATLLRMLELFMGAENFKEGISGYLKDYHHRTASTGDFWKSLAAVFSEGQRLERTLEEWTTLPGMPYVSVRRDPSQPLTFLAQQRRLLVPDGFDPSSGTDSGPTPLWSIPLSYRTSEDDQVKFLWIEGENPVPFHVGLQQPASAWVQFNAGRAAPIVVGYEDEDWAGLSRALQSGEIRRPSDRAGLVADVFLLARAGLADYSTALDLAGFLRSERDLAPWAAAVRALTPLARLLRESTEGYALITKYILDMSKSTIANLTWEDVGSHQDRQLRVLLLELACGHGDGDCQAEASLQFRRWVSGGRVPSPQLRGVVYRHGLSANPSAWDHVWNRFLLEGSAERRRLLRGLAYTQDRDLLTRLLEAISDSKLVRTPDFFEALGWLSDNPAGRPVVWRFITERWRTLRMRYFSNQKELQAMIKLIASYFDTEEHLQEVVRFFNAEQCGPELRREVLGLVSHNIRWLSAHKADVIDWLRGKGASPES